MSQRRYLSCSSAWFWLVFYVYVVFTTEASLSDRSRKNDQLPSFSGPVRNVSVTLGRNALLSCTVNNLGQHKVAWVHLDRQMVVAIHKQVVARLPRFTVTHDFHKTWELHVTQVTEEDRGYYMCQVNTTPMISQKGYLQVYVPPEILDNSTSGSSLVVREKNNITLRCVAEGFPEPHIRWMREDRKPIRISHGNEETQYGGENLVLTTVSRTATGSYLCIASNGIPPSVSKRIIVNVEFSPQMHVPNQLIAASLGDDITLECDVESSPAPITYWSHNGMIVSHSPRITTNIINKSYKYKMTLTIKDLQEEDFGQFLCVATNSFSETNGSIRLNKVPRPTRKPNMKVYRPFPERESAKQTKREKQSLSKKNTNSHLERDQLRYKPQKKQNSHERGINPEQNHFVEFTPHHIPGFETESSNGRSLALTPRDIISSGCSVVNLYWTMYNIVNLLLL